jgi:hypothetical protein
MKKGTRYVVKKAKVLQNEHNSTCRKCKEAAHMVLKDHAFS